MKKFLLLLVLFSQLSFAGPTPQIGSQIWLEPGQTPQQIDNWFKIMSDMDMPVVRLFMQWNFMQTDSNTWDFSLFDNAFRSAEKYKVKIVATLEPNQPPYFYGEEYWYRNQGEKILATHTELTRVKKYLDTVINRYKTSPALDAWMLMNEPGQQPSPDSLAIERFREYAKAKYGTLKSLNDAWLTSFSSFDSIRYNPAWLDGGWTWPSVTIDWITFWRGHLTWFLNWMADQVKRNDDKHILHVNPHALFAYLPKYELPAWMSFLDVLGASAHPSWHFYLYKRNKFAEGLCYINDMVRCAAEPKPYWITELQGGNNIYSGAWPLCPTRDDLAQWLWTSVGSGADRVIYWCLNAKTQGTEAAEWGLLNLEDKPGERLLVSSEIAKIIHANEKFFAGAKPVTSDITILLSPETMVLEQRIKSPSGKPGTNKDAHLKAVLAYYHVLHDLGIPVNVKFIDNFDWTDAKQKRMVILPHAFALTEQQIKKIDAFVFNGNKVIASGLTGLFDQNNKSWIINRRFPLENMFGGTLKDIRYIDDKFDLSMNYYQLSMPAHLWQCEIDNKTGKVLGLMEDKVVAVKNKYGKGEAVWVPSAIDLGAWLYNSDGLKTFVMNECGLYSARLPFRFETPQNDVMIRTMENNGKYVTILINQQAQDVKVPVIVVPQLKPRIIFGDEYAYDAANHSLNLPAGKTIVMMWE